ncbi:AraC family transcriptional regulator [Cupriavidus pampae]|uniref:IS5 family transposase IS4811 n=1 Tax=Cupriavidus pampae TaxID=659251 RepID=A0ABM8XW97_9BURK|nr:AraC family transcriptional regulator [Cupriavidus pampae]CAG9184673.1 IS5 family transposase IS4811 [Cupriavidus pampae]
MSNDPLSQWLMMLAAHCSLSGSLQASGEWAVTFETETTKINVVAEGEAWLVHGDLPAPIRLREGDGFMLTRAGTYALCSDISLTPLPAEEVFIDHRGVIEGVPGTPRGSQCYMVGCALTLDAIDVELLTSALPPVVVVHGEDASAASMRWLIMRLRDELDSPEPGADASQAMLAQMLCVETIRYWCRPAIGPTCAGFLGALRDDRIAAALRAMHDDVARPWRVEELASRVAMSRSAFAARFKQLTGIAPLEYLLRWRMRMAAHALQGRETPMQRIAEAVGYQSDSAFSLAFKRVYGVAPSAYRRREDTADQP